MQWHGFVTVTVIGAAPDGCCCCCCLLIAVLFAFACWLLLLLLLCVGCCCYCCCRVTHFIDVMVLVLVVNGVAVADCVLFVVGYNNHCNNNGHNCCLLYIQQQL